MADVRIAIKPKYVTRKATDKVIFNDGQFLTVIDEKSTRHILSLFDTCHVALVKDDKYYPVDLETYEEQFGLVEKDEAPTVEADEDFGVKKLEAFASVPETEFFCQDDDLKIDCGVLEGTLLKVTNYLKSDDETFDKNGYWLVFKFDKTAAEAEGYSELKLMNTDTEVIDGNNYIYFGESEEDVGKKIIGITGKLTVKEETGDAEEKFVNHLKAKVQLAGDAVNPIDVDGVGYETLQKAFVSLHGKGGTVTINKGLMVGSDRIKLNDGKNYTLVLNNGAEVALGGFIAVYGGSTLTVSGNGTLKEQNPCFGPVVVMNTDKNLTVGLIVGEGIIMKGWAGIFVDKASYNVSVICHGHCIGQNDGSDDGAGIYVNGNVLSGTLTFDGSTEETVGHGMYIAGNIDTTIVNANIAGTITGIEQRAANMKIFKSVVAGGTGEATMKANGNGTTSENCGVAIAQHTSKHPISVSISESTLTGGASFMEGNPQNNEKATEETSILINSGCFVGEVKTLDLEKDCTKFITGGVYTVKPDEKYLAKGYSVKTNAAGNFNVVKA